MKSGQIFTILRARWRIAVLAFLLTVALAVALHQLIPPRYVAETTVMVDVRSPDPVSVLLPPTMLPGSLAMQLEIVKSDRVARKVVRMLGLEEGRRPEEDWFDWAIGKGEFAERMSAFLQRRLQASLARDSSLITISYRDADPTFAAAAANAFAQAYIETSIEMKVEPARQYSRWFGDQAKALRENVEQTQARLSAYQREKGVVVTDGTIDYETAKLNDLSVRLTAVQAETRAAESKQRSRAVALPEVMASAAVQNLRADINRREAQLKEIGVNLGVRHPQYQRMESELAELKHRLVEETRFVESGFAASASVGKANEAELRAEMEAQKRKVLALKKERDEIAVLSREVEATRRAYEAVTNRYTQTSLESQATQTNVTVLNPARPPLQPSFPKPLAEMLLIAIFAGIVLGGAAAIGMERVDKRIRSVEDLTEMLEIPVLAVIEKGTIRQSRLAGWHSETPLLPYVRGQNGD